MSRQCRWGAVAASQRWEVIPDGAALWRTCQWRIRRRRFPPRGWSWTEWWEEMESVCFTCSLEALRQFDPWRGVPLAAFLHTRLRHIVSDSYRREGGYAAHCHGGREREQAQSPAPAGAEDLAAVWAGLQALTEEDRWLAEQLLLEDRTECDVADELGVSQATVSRRKKALLQALRRRLGSTKEKILSFHA
jgi:DNA-directed RNA polymerase specialized sigma24 family protein